MAIITWVSGDVLLGADAEEVDERRDGLAGLLLLLLLSRLLLI